MLPLVILLIIALTGTRIVTAFLHGTSAGALGAFLGVGRKVLFIVASDIFDGIFVYRNVPAGHLSYIFYDHLVVGVFLIVLVALGTHVTRQIVDRPAHVGTAFADQRTDHLSHIFPVMLEQDAPLRIGHPPRCDRQILTRGTRIGRVHIQLKIRHDKEVIPQFVREVGRIAQQRVQVAHHGDDGLGLPRPLAAVFDFEQRRDHLVDMAPVLRQEKFAAGVIIILFHNGIDSRRPSRSRNIVPFGPNTSNF